MVKGPKYAKALEALALCLKKRRERKLPNKNWVIIDHLPEGRLTYEMVGERLTIFLERESRVDTFPVDEWERETLERLLA